MTCYRTQSHYEGLGTLDNIATRFAEGVVNVAVDVRLESNCYRVWLRRDTGQRDVDKLPVTICQGDESADRGEEVLARVRCEPLQARDGRWLFQSVYSGRSGRIGIPNGWTTGAPVCDVKYRIHDGPQLPDDVVDDRIKYRLINGLNLLIGPSFIHPTLADGEASAIEIIDTLFGPLYAR